MRLPIANPKELKLIDVNHILITLVAGLLVLTTAQLLRNINLNKKLKTLYSEKSKLFSQKRSSEVRTGHIVEKFAPFLSNFPHDPESAGFLGQPIDYLVFEEDGITFSEIKSGQSQLSKKQRMIRDNVKNGNVFWEEIRIDEKS